MRSTGSLSKSGPWYVCGDTCFVCVLFVYVFVSKLHLLYNVRCHAFNIHFDSTNNFTIFYLFFIALSDSIATFNNELLLKSIIKILTIGICLQVVLQIVKNLTLKQKRSKQWLSFWTTLNCLIVILFRKVSILVFIVLLYFHRYIYKAK